jgi:SsrA-binding protein
MEILKLLKIDMCDINKVKNKKAYYDYSISEEFDAGIMLTGDEVKSMRLGNVSMNDSFIIIKDNSVYIKNLRISKYERSHPLVAHDENRDKKLLLTRKQIDKIYKFLNTPGHTCVPLLTFGKNNKIKIKIGLAKGKKTYDKRNSLKEKDIKREISRNL